MNGTYFYLDLRALVLIAVLALPFFYAYRWRKGFVEPFFYFTDIKILSNKNVPIALAPWSHRLLWMTLFCWILAFLDPHLQVDRKWDESNGSNAPPTPTHGVAIYVVLDQSGSMKDKVSAQTSTGPAFLSKIDLVEQVTRQFIMGDPSLGLNGRPNDLIGLIFFARAARVMAPLTLDHAAVVQELSKFSTIGDRDQDGTSIGYALYKAANLMAATQHYSQELVSRGEPAYVIKSNVIILLTDGLQDPNPLDKGKRLRNMDVPEAAAYAKQLGIRLYMVNVDPAMATEEFAPYRHIMQRAAELTGGKFYLADKPDSLQNIYHDINQLEKSEIAEPQNYLEMDKRPDLYRRVSFYPLLIGLGLVCLLLSLCLDTLILRKVP